MKTEELLQAVREAFLLDDPVARKAIADAFLEAGDREAGEAIRQHDVLVPACPRCGGDYFTEANRQYRPVIEHRSEDDDQGECVCEDWHCYACKQVTLTVVYRPVCWHHYDNPAATDGFSEPRMIKDLRKTKED